MSSSDPYDSRESKAGPDSAVLDPDVNQRFALVQYQLRTARSQLEAVGPLGALALNSVQDAVESLLWLVAERQQMVIPKGKKDFIDVFDVVIEGLSPASNTTLAGYRTSLVSMNAARVAFKHHGNVPSKETASRHLNRAESFSDSLSSVVFGVPLSEVGLASFIRDHHAKRLLNRALSGWNDGSKQEALGDLRLSFDQLLREFKQRTRNRSSRSPYELGPSSKPSPHDRDNTRRTSNLIEWMQDLDRWLSILILGIDARGYAFFLSHTPDVHYSLNGPPYVDSLEKCEGFSSEIFERCYGFVLETGIRLSQDDVEVGIASGGWPIDYFRGTDPSYF